MPDEKELPSIDEMSQDELIALEDKMVADEESATSGEQEQVETQQQEQESSTEKAAEQPAVLPQDEDAEALQPPGDDVAKHVSPPSKWIKQRQENKQLREQLGSATEKANQYDTLKSELDWMKAALQDRGIEAPTKPEDAFTDENIENIRDEHGDEIADMLKATAAILKNHIPATGQQQQPPVQQQQQAAPVDPGLLTAIDDNDELAYWKHQAAEGNPKLWEMAQAKDKELLADPEMQKLSYAERFTNVVQAVKDDLASGATVKPGKAKDVPTSLSNSSGVVPSPTGSDVFKNYESISSPEKQQAFFDNLSQADKDIIYEKVNL